MNNLTNIITGLPFVRNHEARWHGMDTIPFLLRGVAQDLKTNLQARKLDNVVGFPLEFEHGAQVWPKKCTMQRPIKKSFHVITASERR